MTAVKCKKRIIALMEPKLEKGGISRQDLFSHLEMAFHHSVETRYKVGDQCVSPAEVYDALLVLEPIFWDRIGAYMDVSVRLIAEALLGDDLNGVGCYIQGELCGAQPPQPLEQHRPFHLYVSEHNMGALDLVEEVRSWLSGFSDKHELHITTNFDDLHRCDHMLLYLNSKTWSSGNVSTTFVAEVMKALGDGVSLVLAHEPPTLDDEIQHKKHGCEFSTFFKTTPRGLLNLNVYGKVAVPLRQMSSHRPTALALLVEAIAQPPVRIRPKEDALKRESHWQQLHDLPRWLLSTRYHSTRQMASSSIRPSEDETADDTRPTSKDEPLKIRWAEIATSYKQAISQKKAAVKLQQATDRLREVYTTIIKRQMGGPFLLWRAWAL